MLMVIDWSIWMTIVGTVATIVFGIWAILIAKSRAYPGRLAFFHDRSIRLFDDITGSLPQLTVNYKGEPVKKNLTLIKGYLVNTGTKDLTADMVETPLTFELAEGYRWLEVSAKSSSSSAECATIVDSSKVTFSLGLFRCQEFLRFEGLIEVSDGKKWGGVIYHSHRIADTSGVKWKRVPQKPKKLSRDLQFWICLIFCSAFTAIVIRHILHIDWVAKNWADCLMSLVGGLFLLLMVGILAVAFPLSNRFDRRIRRVLHLDSE